MRKGTQHGLKAVAVLFFLLFIASQGYAATATNVTVRLEWDLGSDVANYTGNGQITGQSVEESADFPYIVSEKVAPSLFGLVNFGDFIRFGYDVTGNTVKANMTQRFDNGEKHASFLLPFTAGDRSDVEQRRDNIQSGFLDDPDFLDFPGPAFAYPLTTKKAIRAMVRYPLHEFVIDGPGYSLSPGIHNLLVRNNGTNANNRLLIALSRQ